MDGILLFLNGRGISSAYAAHDCQCILSYMFCDSLTKKRCRGVENYLGDGKCNVVWLTVTSQKFIEFGDDFPPDVLRIASQFCHDTGSLREKLIILHPFLDVLF